MKLGTNARTDSIVTHSTAVPKNGVPAIANTMTQKPKALRSRELHLVTSQSPGPYHSLPKKADKQYNQYYN